jgi:TBC1 domain family member 13
LQKPPQQDHPLSTSNSSQWKQYYDDQKIWETIEKDVKRTRCELGFFQSALDPNRTSKEDIERLEKQHRTKKAELTQEQQKNFVESHSDSLARVLFIFGKLNKGIKYVQGMNEVIAVLYYCFWKYGNESIISTHYLESDLFHCFSNIMGELKDGFIRDLDQEASGVFGRCQAIEAIIRTVDKPVWNTLKRLKVETQYYALRWIMVLMC